MNKSTVLLVTNAPTPYRIPLFNELHSLFDESGLALTVVFGVAGYSRRKWVIDMVDCQFDYVVLNSSSLSMRDGENPVFSYAGLIRTIRERCPSIVITPEFSLATTKIFLWGLLSPTSYVIWSGGIESRGRRISWLRRLQRRLLIFRASAFIVYGSRARDLLVSLGANPDRIRIAINTVDTGYFQVEADRLRQARGKNEPFQFLYVGHITPGKRLDLLLSAAALLAEHRDDFQIDIVGDGPSLESLRSEVKELNISQHITFHGYRQKEEIPVFMAASDCFVFPSEYDVWGLVLVEAMASGLPCLSSVEAGATTDLVQEGRTGFSLDFADCRRVVDRMEWMLDNREEAGKMGLQAQNYIAEKVNLTVSAQGMVDAVALGLKCR